MRRRELEYRDVELGSALAALEVPDYPPTFREQLAQLIAERAALPVRALPSRRRLLLAATLAVAACWLAISFGTGLMHVPFSTGPEPGTAGAAELMSQKMSEAMATMGTFAGEFRLSTSHPGGKSALAGSFAATSGGDLRVESTVVATEEGAKQTWGPLGTQRTATYNAVEHVLLVSDSPPGTGARVTRTTGVWPAPAVVPLPSPFDFQGYVQLIRSAVEDHDVALQVQDTTYESRPAWTATIRESTADIRIVVDKATGVVVDVASSSGEGVWAVTEQLRLSDVKVDAGLPASTFSVSSPADAEVSTLDRGAVYGSVAEAEQRAGYAMLLPQTLPDGFSAAQVATLPYPDGSALWTAYSGHTGPRGTEIAVEYARGFNRLRLYVAPATLARAELADGAWIWARAGLGFRVARLSQGPFAGQDARIWFDQRGCRLVVADATYAMLIEGDATPDELVRMANSLSVHGAAGAPPAVPQTLPQPSLDESSGFIRAAGDFDFVARAYALAMSRGDVDGAASLFPPDMQAAARRDIAEMLAAASPGAWSGRPQAVNLVLADSHGRLFEPGMVSERIEKYLRALASAYGVAASIDIVEDDGAHHMVYGAFIDGRCFLVR